MKILFILCTTVFTFPADAFARPMEMASFRKLFGDPNQITSAVASNNLGECTPSVRRSIKESRKKWGIFHYSCVNGVIRNIFVDPESDINKNPAQFIESNLGLFDLKGIPISIRFDGDKAVEVYQAKIVPDAHIFREHRNGEIPTPTQPGVHPISTRDLEKAAGVIKGAYVVFELNLVDPENSNSEHPVILEPADNSVAGAELATLIDSPGCGGVEYKFNPKKISEDQLRVALRVSPGHLVEWSNLEFLELCVAGDPKYQTCGSRDWSDPNFLRNAKVNLDSIQEKIRDLNTIDFAPELKPIVEYWTTEIGYRYWVQESRLEYYRSWDTDALRRKFKSADLSKTCESAIKRLESASDKATKYSIAQSEWHNCATNAYGRFFKPYPINVWNSFMKAYGITAKEIKEECD